MEVSELFSDGFWHSLHYHSFSWAFKFSHLIKFRNVWVIVENDEKYFGFQWKEVGWKLNNCYRFTRTKLILLIIVAKDTCGENLITFIFDSFYQAEIISTIINSLRKWLLKHFPPSISNIYSSQQPVSISVKFFEHEKWVDEWSGVRYYLGISFTVLLSLPSLI